MILQGKNAIITGAAGGIGKATVECFAANGANIFACELKPTDNFVKDMADIAESTVYGLKRYTLM